MVLNVLRNRTAYWGRGEGGEGYGGGGGGGGEGIIYLSLHCHHQNAGILFLLNVLRCQKHIRDKNAGIKMEGLLYLQKYGIGGPDFGIKEEFVTEKGRHLFHARAMNVLVVYSSAN